MLQPRPPRPQIWPLVYYFKRAKFLEFIEKSILGPAIYDPLAFVGLPKAWRDDIQNKIDTLAIATTILALSYGTDALSDKTRKAYTNTVMLATISPTAANHAETSHKDLPGAATHNPWPLLC